METNFAKFILLPKKRCHLVERGQIKLVENRARWSLGSLLHLDRRCIQTFGRNLRHIQTKISRKEQLLVSSTQTNLVLELYLHMMNVK